jgi:methylmalonyl-CoA/ethylmalonyl-CoA epimerase
MEDPVMTTTTTGPGLSRLAQIAMRAKDTARAVTFYRDVLGVPLLFEAPPGLAFFDCGGVRLMLGPAEGSFDHPGSVLYFAVEDIAAVHDTLRTRGVNFAREPHLIAKLPDRDVLVAFFEDTEGNTLGLMEERRR